MMIGLVSTSSSTAQGGCKGDFVSDKSNFDDRQFHDDLIKPSAPRFFHSLGLSLARSLALSLSAFGFYCLNRASKVSPIQVCAR